MAFTPSPNSGVLNRSNSQNAKAPDWNGYCTIEGDLLDYILMTAEAGGDIKIDLSAWQKTGTKGDFLSLSAQVPYSVRSGGGASAPNKYAKAVPTPTGGRYDSTAKREPVPEHQPRRGGIAEQAMNRSAPIQTTRGPMQRTPAPKDEDNPWD